MPVAEDGSDSAEAGIISHEAVGDFAERSAGGVHGLARITQGRPIRWDKNGIRLYLLHPSAVEARRILNRN
jgi:hypothetical protein